MAAPDILTALERADAWFARVLPQCPDDADDEAREAAEEASSDYLNGEGRADGESAWTDAEEVHAAIRAALDRARGEGS